MFERQNQDVLAEHYTKLIDDKNAGIEAGTNAGHGDGDEDNDVLSVKRRHEAGDTALDQASSSSSFSDSDSENEKAPRSTRQPGANGAIKKTIQLTSNPDEALIVDSKRREKLL